MNDWKDALLKERTLWDVYLRSPGLSDRPFNKYTAIVTFVLLALFAVFDRCFFTTASPIIDYAETIRSWASIGFGFSSSILGFLLAGFTVFATITKPRLFVALAQVDHDKSDLSELQYAFFSFLNVFAHYLAFLSLTLIVIMMGEKGGVAARIISQITPYFPTLKGTVLIILFVVIGTWMIILILKLKSFLWNVYQAVLLSVVHEGDLIEAEKKEEESMGG